MKKSLFGKKKRKNRIECGRICEEDHRLLTVKTYKAGHGRGLGKQQKKQQRPHKMISTTLSVIIVIGISFLTILIKLRGCFRPITTTSESELSSTMTTTMTTTMTMTNITNTDTVITNTEPRPNTRRS